MSTLIIHPNDHTTDFLSPIYQDIKDPTIFTHKKNMEQVLDGIMKHDRVIMMGHGSPNGLFSVNQFNTGLYVIGAWCADFLEKKDENIFIWCNADKFVEKHQLKGFYSGMFISEVAEANFCGVTGVSQNMVDESNETFAILLGQYINDTKENIYKNIKESYGKLAKSNPVANYNWKRLYFS